MAKTQDFFQEEQKCDIKTFYHHFSNRQNKLECLSISKHSIFSTGYRGKEKSCIKLTHLKLFSVLLNPAK
jgi:hypothetical protein